MPLYPHQEEIVAACAAQYAAGRRAVLMQAATGFGKTFVAAEIIRRAVAKGRSVAFLAHLDLLCGDTSARLTAAGIEHGVIQAGRQGNPVARVQVCSLQTLHARPECRPSADLLVLDECRRAAAPTVRAILEAYPRARLLGLDGTPERGDGTPLGDLFDAMVHGPSIRWLTAHGFLVTAIVLSPPMPLEGALALDPVEALATHAPGRRAIVFARDIDHARDIAARAPAPALVTGETSTADRARIRADVAEGRVRTLVNVDVYRDGADLPSLDCVVIARSMSVVSGWLQAVGRGLRAHPGKRDCLVLDLAGVAIMMGLPEDDRRWSLTGAAVQRTGEALKQLARCPKCYAVFHAGPPACPRCGASTRGARVPRRATRIERHELTRLDERPQHVRDAIVMQALEKRARASGRYSERQIPHVVRGLFTKATGRAPEPPPGGECAA